MTIAYIYILKDFFGSVIGKSTYGDSKCLNKMCINHQTIKEEKWTLSYCISYINY